MKLTVIGLNHQTAPLHIREKLAFPAGILPDAVRDLNGRAAAEAVILSTCNRTELYCVGDAEMIIGWLAEHRGVSVEALRPYLYVYGCSETIRHAFRVASGLDSMVLGEPQILGQMKEAVQGPQELSQHAPRLYTMRINPDKIREVIGKGGETIRSITAETHTEINISDDGVVTIAATTAEAGEAAKARIEMITAEVEVGKVYEGTVVKILDNNVGAIVSVMPGKDGLVHISQIAHERVKDVNDYLRVGQNVRVKALEVDDRGRVRLSMKALLDQTREQ